MANFFERNAQDNSESLTPPASRGQIQQNASRWNPLREGTTGSLAGEGDEGEDD